MKKLLFSLLTVMICLGVMPSYNQAAAATQEPQVKVKLIKYLGNQISVSLIITGNYYLNGSFPSLLIKGHSYTVKTENGAISLYDGTKKITSGTTISITPVNYLDHAKINNREYAGSFDFTLENGYVRPVNTINLEDYLKSVVPAEMPGSWPAEALKAQAVAARTYAYKRLNQTINDTPIYQVYAGVTSHYANSSTAVDATAGQILTYNGSPIDAVFSSSNGGKTESEFDVSNPTPMPYFKVQDDPFDRTSVTFDYTIYKQQIDPSKLDLIHPDSWWNTTTEKDTDITNNIKAYLNNHGYQNKQLKIVAIPNLAFSDTPTGSGRYFKGNLTVEFYVRDMVDSSGALKLQTLDINDLADTIRSILGTWLIKSNLLTVQEHNPTDPAADSYEMKGSGYGHGVGLSQYGARYRAASSDSTVNTYSKILSFYYTGALLNKEYAPQTKQLKTGWIFWGGKWYFFDSNGAMKTDWVYTDHKWYFMDTNGVMKTGWVYTGGKWYYLETSGAMKTGWVYTGGKWYYLDTSGAMITGWLSTGGKRYYLDGSGAMKTGWVQIGKYWYYFYSNGAMAANTTIQGHKINSSGVRVN